MADATVGMVDHKRVPAGIFHRINQLDLMHRHFIVSEIAFFSLRVRTKITSHFCLAASGSNFTTEDTENTEFSYFTISVGSVLSVVKFQVLVLSQPVFAPQRTQRTPSLNYKTIDTLGVFLFGAARNDLKS